MFTPDEIPVGSDPQDAEDFTICPHCGEDLPHHMCPESFDE
jgi:hypothetical protein